jgi:2-hydroxy-6-oxonona-2,4-dienedioate hydrolase
MIGIDQGKFITLDVSGDQIRTHYYEFGEGGESIIFVHTGGHANSAYMCWYLNLDAFAEAGYHVYAPDAVGVGLTERIGQPTLPHSDFLFSDLGDKFVLAFMDAMAIKKAHFIGNSMGSNLLARFALTEPGRLRSMMLTGGEPRVETEESAAIAKTLGRTPMMESNRSMLNKSEITLEDMRQATIHFFYDPNHSRLNEVARMRLETINKPGMLERIREDSLKSRERGRFHYPASDLARIQAPTYLIHGRDERFFYPAEIAQTLMEYAMKVALVIPDCSLTLLPYCGHWPQIEMADRFNSLALQFIESVRIEESRRKKGEKV